MTDKYSFDYTAISSVPDASEFIVTYLNKGLNGEGSEVYYTVEPLQHANNLAFHLEFMTNVHDHINNPENQTTLQAVGEIDFHEPIQMPGVPGFHYQAVYRQ